MTIRAIPEIIALLNDPNEVMKMMMMMMMMMLLLMMMMMVMMLLMMMMMTTTMQEVMAQAAQMVDQLSKKDASKHALLSNPNLMSALISQSSYSFSSSSSSLFIFFLFLLKLFFLFLFFFHLFFSFYFNSCSFLVFLFLLFLYYFHLPFSPTSPLFPNLPTDALNRTTDPTTQQHLASALHKLSQNRQGLLYLFKSGGIPALVRLLR